MRGRFGKFADLRFTALLLLLDEKKNRAYFERDIEAETLAFPFYIWIFNYEERN